MPFAVAAAGIGFVGTMMASDTAADAQDNATNAQRQSAADQTALGRDQLAWDKTQYYDQKPLRDQTAQSQLDLMQQQGKLAGQQGEIAKDYNDYNKTTFRPLEQKLVGEASGYDTPERRAAAEESARADTENAFASSQAGLNRSLQRAGVAPGSGKSLALMQDAALTKAGALAGATTGASRQIETMGHARMMDAASLGRNLPSAQATAAGTSSTAANAGTAAGTAAINSAAAGIPAVNAGYAGAMYGGNSAGQLYGQAATSYGQMANAANGYLSSLGKSAGQADWSGVAGTIGNWLNPMTVDTAGYGIGGSGGSLGFGGGDFSSKKMKKNTNRMQNTRKALQEIDKVPVKEGWQYDPTKGGPDDGRAHTGPMAEDVQAAMGDEVAPGGKMIDRVSMNGKLLAGMQELSKRVKKLEGKRA